MLELGDNSYDGRLQMVAMFVNINNFAVLLWVEYDATP